MTGPTSWSATRLVAALSDGAVSAVEVVEAHLARIDAVNSDLNAVVTRCDERAMTEARQADDRHASGQPLGRLHGLPITIKDALDTAGVRTTGGTLGRIDYVPEADATVVARLRAEGAIVIGKTNTPDLTLRYETNNLIFGQTANPYDLSKSPGGSSGGAAAIIGAAGSPLDLGTDTGGSIRLPAHFCGIAGLMPTAGRVPRAGLIIPPGTPADQFTKIGPMARCVADLELALHVIAGPDPTDPTAVPVALGDRSLVNVAGLRVGWYVDDGIVPAHGSVADATRAAVSSLVDAGAGATEVRLPLIEYSSMIYGGAIQADGGVWIQRLLATYGSTRSDLANRADIRPVTASEYRERLSAVTAFRVALARFMADYDLIVCPPHAYPPLPPGEVDTTAIDGAGYLQTYNLTGWPVVVVRAGSTTDGLPVGVQLVANAWREDVALAAGEVVENSLGGWRPPPARLIPGP